MFLANLTLLPLMLDNVILVNSLPYLDLATFQKLPNLLSPISAKNQVFNFQFWVSPF